MEVALKHILAGIFCVISLVSIWISSHNVNNILIQTFLTPANSDHNLYAPEAMSSAIGSPKPTTTIVATQIEETTTTPNLRTQRTVVVGPNMKKSDLQFDFVMDVGANRGRWTNEASGHSRRIVTVEANSFLIAKLRKRFARREKITVIHAAIDEVNNRTIEFYLDGNESTFSSANPNWLTKPGYRFGKRGVMRIEHVPTRTLDSLILEYGVPDLLKVDVEGYEEIAFKGLSQKVPIVCFEWSHEIREQIDFILRRLEGLGLTKASIQYEDTIGDSYLEPLIQAKWMPIPDFLNDLQRLVRAGPARHRGWGMVWVKA